MYAAPGLSLKAEGLEEQSLKSWMAYRRGLFPALYSLCTLAIFVPPIIEGIHIGIDASVKYWIGYYSFAVLLIPAMLVASHMIHVFTGKPQFYAVLLSTAVPSIIVIAIGNIHLVQIGRISERLMSTSCSSFDDNAVLNSAYRAAEEVLSGCVGRTATATGESIEAVRAHLTLQDCIGQGQPEDKFSREWWYLSNLQAEQECTGWCQPAKTSVWMADITAGDACSSTAGNILSGKVQRAAQHMVVTGLIDLVISVVALGVIQETLIRQQVEW